MARFSMTITADQVTARLPLTQVGSPSSIQFCAFAMSAVPGGGPIFFKDYAPDGWCEGGDTDPL